MVKKQQKKVTNKKKNKRQINPRAKNKLGPGKK